ncbi:condensation domain-containing protein [Streptomyces sp. NBC_01005]|uniref:condensation domain-containing protein n=1 Tax=unclassified Streptomyces TaxID=2593676 RepID=UPI002E33E924|nr:condensation domain-containing protein [Streptomyces sp. NBC_01362]WSW05722.1 condensation domain-containing protein [Streptomyces sp. NBC_01005]WTC95225.1 condensation domain-containing protein [Streptomyces sp. NBC_01650]
MRPSAEPRPAGPVPLSFAQRRLWFLDTWQGSSAACDVPLVPRLSGAVDRAASRAAFQDVLERYDVLRTVLAEHDGEPVPDVVPAGQAARSGLTEEAVPADVAGWVEGIVRRGFDVTMDLPFRAVPGTISPTESVLVIVVCEGKPHFFCAVVLTSGAGSSQLCPRTVEVPQDVGVDSEPGAWRAERPLVLQPAGEGVRRADVQPGAENRWFVLRSEAGDQTVLQPFQGLVASAPRGYQHGTAAKAAGTVEPVVGGARGAEQA